MEQRAYMDFLRPSRFVFITRRMCWNSSPAMTIDIYSAVCERCRIWGRG